MFNVHLIFRYLPFPFASHPIVSNGAIKVRLITIGSYSRNLTDIALDFVRAHSSFLFVEAHIDVRVQSVHDEPS